MRSSWIAWGATKHWIHRSIPFRSSTSKSCLLFEWIYQFPGIDFRIKPRFYGAPSNFLQSYQLNELRWMWRCQSEAPHRRLPWESNASSASQKFFQPKIWVHESWVQDSDFLVGGYHHPSEKICLSKWESSPNRDENWKRNVWNHHPVFLVGSTCWMFWHHKNQTPPKRGFA